MLGERSDQRGLWEADRLYLDHVGRESFYGVLASPRGRLFRDADFAEFYCPDNGRDSVPPSLLATALLLQSHDKVSDAEAKARADFDLRWKVALGIEVEDRTFAKRKNPNLVNWNTIRDKSWLLKPSGLGAFGLLVHDLREAAKVESPGQERVWVEEQVKKVSQLDWSNNSPIFKGTLVKGGRAQGSSTAISHAAVVLEVKLNQSQGGNYILQR